MTTDLCPEAAVVHITTPQIITQTEAVVPVSAGVRGPPAAGGSAVELGRRLLLAARAGDTPLVLDLMAKGAPFTTDWLGTSPLHLAASNAHTETCGVLLRAGVSRDSRTKVERTPLHLAAYAGHANVASLLLEHGALVDCRDMLRMTPLHWAAERGHGACCGVLLRHGADARALSKFLKSPHQLAAAQGHDHVLALIDDALKQREAARSVQALALLDDRPREEEPAEAAQRLPTTRKISDIKIQEVIKIKPKQSHEKAARVEIKSETVEQNGDSQSGEGAAAQLLRRHGITLLPHDEGSTLLNALQSGRTVVLSDAGKLMLKESSGSAGPPGARAAAASTTAATRARGVVLTATPVRAPPPGVKVFTLNNRLRPPAKDQPRRITLQDNQIKFVQLPADARVVSPRRAARARRVTPVAGGGVPATAPRPPVKIIMNKTNFERLVAGARLDATEPAATEATTSAPGPDSPVTPTSVVITPDSASRETATSGSETAEAATAGASEVASLVAQLAAAQRTVAALSSELRATRARLTRYEPE